MSNFILNTVEKEFLYDVAAEAIGTNKATLSWPDIDLREAYLACAPPDIMSALSLLWQWGSKGFHEDSIWVPRDLLRTTTFNLAMQVKGIVQVNESCCDGPHVVTTVNASYRMTFNVEDPMIDLDYAIKSGKPVVPEPFVGLLLPVCHQLWKLEEVNSNKLEMIHHIIDRCRSINQVHFFFPGLVNLCAKGSYQKELLNRHGRGELKFDSFLSTSKRRRPKVGTLGIREDVLNCYKDLDADIVGGDLFREASVKRLNEICDQLKVKSFSVLST